MLDTLLKLFVCQRRGLPVLLHPQGDAYLPASAIGPHQAPVIPHNLLAVLNARRDFERLGTVGCVDRYRSACPRGLRVNLGFDQYVLISDPELVVPRYATFEIDVPDGSVLSSWSRICNAQPKAFLGPRT